MKDDVFKAQIARLKTEWPNAFGAARCEAMWVCYRGLDDSVFIDAVTDVLLNPPSYGSPGQKHFEIAVDKIQRGRASRGQSTGEKSDYAPPSPSVIARVRAMVASVVHGAPPAARDEDWEQKREAARAKLSPRDLAAGERE